MNQELEIRAPYDNKLIKKISLDDQKKVEAALKTANQLSQESPLPLYQRIEILEKTISLLNGRKEKFAKIAAHEGGKPLIDSKVELDRAVQGIRNAIESVKEMRGLEIPMNLTPSSQNRLAYTMREPIGTVVGISAFNHPFNLIVHQVIPAVAVGCPIIIKPALTTPLSCFNLIETLYEAGLPKPWCQILVCDNENSERLVTDSRVRFFSFIGSAKVGWYLRSKLAPGTRCTLEHGGAAPVIIEPDADIKEMIPLLTKGGFYHAGQVCVSVQRVFVHEAIADKVSQSLSKSAEKLKVGDPTLEETEVGPLILPRENDRVAQWVEEGIKEGGKLLTGGKKISESCYSPTILFNPSPKSKVSTQEIFGPVICIYSYKDRNQAIKQANSLPYSFQASVFTKNLDVAFDTVKKINAATVMVNDHTAFRVDWMPFAGRKHSGLGVGGIPYTMKDITEEKLMVIKSSVL